MQKQKEETINKMKIKFDDMAKNEPSTSNAELMKQLYEIAEGDLVSQVTMIDMKDLPLMVQNKIG